jgi:hypothetical protein
VQLIHFSDGATSVRDNLLYDSQHATECAARPLAGGSIRCIPDSGAIQTFFSDMSCTQKINVMQIAGPASCGAAKVPAFALRGVAAPAGMCGPSYEIYTVGAQYTGMLFQNTGTCTSFDPTGYQIYQLGTLRPLSEFPLATVVRDP